MITDQFNKENNQKRKVLMIAHAFPPFQPIGYSIRVVKFIKYLPSLNWHPVVLSIDDQQEYEFMRKEGSETMLSEIQKDIKIYRTSAGEPSLKYLQRELELSNKNYIFKIFFAILKKLRSWSYRNLLFPDRQVLWLPFALKNGKKIIEDEKIDVIFATSPPYTDALIGAFLKKITKRPLILDFRDDWIDTPNYHSKSAIVRMIFRNMEKFSVANANKVVLVTEFSRNEFIKRYPAQPKEKFIFIPNGCDLEEFDELDSISVKTDNKKFNLFHSGSLNASENYKRNPEILFRSIREIFNEIPDLEEKMALAFTGYLPEKIKELVNTYGLLSNVKELGFLPRDEWLSYMKNADLLLAINYERWSTIIPGKIYEYWAVGGPPILLLSSPGAAADLIGSYHLGYSVDPNDAWGIKRSILDVYQQKISGEPIIINKIGIKEFDRSNLTDKLAQVFTELVKF